jgi:hypothetical protein
MVKKLCFSFVLTAFVYLLSFSQPSGFMRIQNEGKFGVGASFSNGKTGIILPYWVTNKFVVAPSLNFSYFQKLELDLVVGLNTRHYIQNDDLSSYFGFRVGSMLLIPYAEEEMNKSLRTDLFAGVTFGMEYFLAPQFSMGVEVQGDFVKSDERSQRFNNAGGFGFIIAPVVLAIFYF